MQSNRETAIRAMMDDHIVMYEFLKSHLGALLGEGSFRYVFDHPTRRDQVIKIDMSDQNQNVIEFDVWNTVKLIPELAMWFCPCVEISPCGRILIMKKAHMNKHIGDYPAKLPSFMMDIKKQNFGFYKGKCVCVDYGYNLLYVTGKSWSLVKAIW